MFVDSAVVMVRAGKGGNGIISFRHERYVSRGGPDGGDGGDGGNVVFVASTNQNTLSKFRFQKELKAGDGKNGANAKCHGKAGEDLEVHVPVGTQVRVGSKVIVDFIKNSQREIIALGGKGGFGNAHFTTSVRQAPRIAEKGDEGESLELELELKIIADVGLVGLPNAGKSTLLAACSAAKPKIANYPFTTLNPHLGVVSVGKNQELLIADIPGLIDGASAGKGLGVEFLRHVERTKILLQMIDVYSDDVVRDYKVIQNELKNYKIDLSKKPQVIALTKIDGLDEDIVQDQVKNLKKIARNTEIFTISSLSGLGLKPLLYKLHEIVQKAQKSQKSKKKSKGEKLPVIGLSEDNDSWQIEIKRKKVIISGKKIERFAARTDFENEEAVRRLRDIMNKMGIMHDLERSDVQLGAKIYFSRK